MFSSTIRRAASVATPVLSEAAGQLLPPLPLLRRLLRVHKRLPDEMRFMGDSYVKAEFRRTRTTDNPIYIIGFLQTWKLYLDDLEQQTASEGEVFRGRKLSEETFEKLSNEQAGQLYELMHATKDIWKSPEELETEAVKQEIQRAKDDEAAVQAGKTTS